MGFKLIHFPYFSAFLQSTTTIPQRWIDDNIRSKQTSKRREVVFIVWY